MKLLLRYFWIFFLLISIIDTAGAQELQYEKSIIKELSSQKYHGRAYTHNGIHKSAKFIQKKYSALGLKPFEKEYLQKMAIDVNTFPGKVKLCIDNQKLMPGVDYLVHPSSCPVKGKFKIAMLNLNDLDNGYKIQQALEKAGDGFLCIDEGNSDTLSPDRRMKMNSFLNALLFMPDGNISGILYLTEKKLTWGVSVVQAPRTLIQVKKESLSLEKPNEIRINIKSEFKEGYSTANVVGYIQGKEVPDSFIVFTAHYDHLGTMGRKTYFPGANDNASGVAMMLSMAKYFTENPPRYSLAFIALTGEEAGLLGAKHYVENPNFELSRIRFLVNFDLAGTGEEGIKVVNGAVYDNEFQILKAINEENHYLNSVQKRGEACNSDHCMFYSKNVPSFFIYTLGGSSHYHDIYDEYGALSLAGFSGYQKLMQEFVNNIQGL